MNTLLLLRPRDPNSTVRDDVQSTLLHELGSTYLIGKHSNGAPYFIHHPAVHLSLSHTEEAYMIGVTDQQQRIGVDLEQNFSKALHVLPRIATSDEQEILQVSGCSAIALWCAKEATFKAFSDQITLMTTPITLVSISDNEFKLLVRNQHQTPIAHTIVTIQYYDQELKELNPTDRKPYYCGAFTKSYQEL